MKKVVVILVALLIATAVTGVTAASDPASGLIRKESAVEKAKIKEQSVKEKMKKSDAKLNKAKKPQACCEPDPIKTSNQAPVSKMR